MKIVIVGPTNYEYSYSIERSLRKLNIEVLFYSIHDYYTECNYFERKLYKLGIKKYKTNHDLKWEDGLLRSIDDFKPNKIIFLCGLMLSDRLLSKIYIEKHLWLWDSIRRVSMVDKYLHYFNKIFLFEYSDIDYLVDTLDITRDKLYYQPMGYDSDLFYDRDKKRDLDVSFIGMPSNTRLKLLECVAEYISSINGKMYVGGIWYDNRYFWKINRFKKKYKNLYKYIDNKFISAEDAADIYSRSKICLNINTDVHKCINPRTFEILATNSFEMMNSGQEIHELFNPLNAYVTYENGADLIDKIKYYLNHEEERSKLAYSGQMEIKMYSMDNIVDNVVNKILD